MKTILYLQSSLAASNNSDLDGVYRYAKSANWKIRVAPYSDAAYIRGDRANGRDIQDLGGLLKFWKPDGVIVECGAAPTLLTSGNFRPVPVVFVDRVRTEKDVSVTADDGAIAELAAKELLSLGFRTYAYVPWKKPVSWSVERGEAFSRLVKMNGLKFHQFRQRPFGDAAETYRAWLRTWLRNAPKPMGVFAANDIMASHVLSCAELERIDVPNELAVIGVDNDLEICERTTPSLTSILLDNERAGYLAARLLDERMLHPRRRLKSVTFGPVCVYHRQSTFAYSRKDDRVSVALKLIRRNACDGLKAKDVIAEMGCSRRLAELRFREVTGHSILEEILSVRIERAKYLLEHSEKSIAEVAKSCGYGSANALRKVFAAETGKNPLIWRKRAE